MTTTEMIISHVICNFVIVLIQCVEISILVLYFFEMGSKTSELNLLIVLLLAINGICGMVVGIFVSSICKTHFETNFAGTGILLAFVMLGGNINQDPAHNFYES